MKRIASLISLLMLLVVAGSAPASAHHVNWIDSNIVCQVDRIDVSFHHNIYGGKKLEYEVRVNGTTYRASTLPDSRWNTVRSFPIDGCGDISLYVWAKASDQSDSKAVEHRNSKYCDCPDVFAPYADYIVCGDPRLILTLGNDGTKPVTFTIRYKTGRNVNGKFGTLTFDKIVLPGQERTVLRWIKGGSFLKILARDGENREAVVAEPTPAPTPWGKGTCPAGLKQARKLRG